MDPFLLWLESTALSTWIRESTSVFAFPGILSAHAIGMGLAAGVNAALALRLLGAATHIPVSEFRRFVPFMWFGFWLNAASGLALFIAYPTKAITNPVFWAKLTLIAVAMWIFLRLRGHVFVEEPRPLAGSPRGGEGPAKAGHYMPGLKMLAITSLVCWAGAIFTGRFLAYTYTRLMADW